MNYGFEYGFTSNAEMRTLHMANSPAVIGIYWNRYEGAWWKCIKTLETAGSIPRWKYNDTIQWWWAP